MSWILNATIGDGILLKQGNREAMYLVTAEGNAGYIELRRVMLGKTKIDNIRFPETISIQLYKPEKPKAKKKH